MNSSKKEEKEETVIIDKEMRKTTIFVNHLEIK